MTENLDRRRSTLQRQDGAGSWPFRAGAAVLLGAAMLGLPPAAQAGPAGSRFDLLGLQVFAKRSIQAERSDYEGPAAAGEAMDLTDFQVDGDVTAGHRLAVTRGQVRGFVRSPDVQLAEVFSSGKAAVTDAALEMASLKLDMLSARLSALPATATVEVGPAPDGKTDIRALAQGDMDVVDVSGASLTAAGEDRTRLVLAGDTRSQMVVRIHGRSLRMRHVGFALEGGLEPARVVFLFPEADELEVAYSGGARSGTGQDWNWPGSVLAPNALLRFGAATITGQVFARAIVGIPGLPSGQVDRFPGAGDTGFTPSQVLQRIDGDSFADLLRDHRSATPWDGLAPHGCRLVCSREAEAGQ